MYEIARCSPLAHQRTSPCLREERNWLYRRRMRQGQHLLCRSPRRRAPGARPSRRGAATGSVGEATRIGRAANHRAQKSAFRWALGSHFPLNQRTFPPRDEESRGGGAFGARA